MRERLYRFQRNARVRDGHVFRRDLQQRIRELQWRGDGWL
jgi:hypothetical protein